MTEEDEELPLAWHVVSAPQHFYFVEDSVFLVFMGTQKVVVSDPEGKVIVGAVDVIETVGRSVRSLVGAVQPFDHLLERPKFFGDGIVVGKSDDLGDLECEVFPKFLCEFHCSQGIGAVTVSDEPEVLRQFCESPECHAHSKDAGADTAVIRDLVADDGSGSGIHNEPDVGFYATDFDIGLISGEHAPFFVRILVDKGFDADGGGLTVVGDLLVGDADIIQIFQGLRCLAQGEAEVDMQGKAQGHDMGIVSVEFQGRCIFRKGSQIHAEKIHRELTVDIVEFIFVLTIILFEIFLIHLFEVVEIVRAFWIDALVEDEVLTFFLGDESIAAVWATQLHGREAAFQWGESGVTDFTQYLAFGTVVFIKERFWGIAAGAGAVIRDVAFRTAADGTDFLAITFFVVRDKVFIIPVLPEVSDKREFINLELLVFRGVGIIKNPLFKRDISADKVEQPAVLLVKRMN